MRKIREFLKYFWVPLLLFIGVLTFAGYMAKKEIQTNNLVVKEALKGNPYAAAIYKKYEKPWKVDEKILKDALKGKQNALNLLNIIPDDTFVYEAKESSKDLLSNSPLNKQMENLKQLNEIKNLIANLDKDLTILPHMLKKMTDLIEIQEHIIFRELGKNVYQNESEQAN